MISLILFDLDGTIIDSEPLAFQAILDKAKDWDLPIRKEDAAFVAGKKWELAIDFLHQKYAFPCSKEESSEAIIKRYKEILQSSLRVIPGVVDSIQNFAKHFDLALVSGSHRAEVFWALKKLQVDHLFKIVLGAEDYPLSKPAPDGYQKAMKLLARDPKSCLVFEDSNPGIHSAKAAGVKVVAVTSTNHFGQDLSGADRAIVDFTGIDANWVKKNF